MERCQKRRNRNSDRRKTCLPVLQPFFAADMLPPPIPGALSTSLSRRCSTGEEQNRGSGSETDETIDVKVYQIGSEQVEMQKDKVKRRTKGAYYIMLFFSFVHFDLYTGRLCENVTNTDDMISLLKYPLIILGFLHALLYCAHIFI